MDSLRLAFGCLTILPVGPRSTPRDVAFGRSWIWFPLIGLLIGSILVAANHVLAQQIPAAVTAALILSLWIVLTGALHLDGLADVCDGLYAGRTPDERLRIMKDPHIGTMAAVAITAHLILKFAMIHSLPASALAPSMLLAPCMARYAMGVLGTTLPYARTDGGTAASFVRHATPRSLLIVLTVALVLSWLIARRAGLGLLAVASGVAWLLRTVFFRTLGGVTGDALGATGEIVESVVLFCGVMWLGR